MPRGPGAVARAGPRARPSDPPARATEQGRLAVGPLAVREKPRQRYPTARRPLGSRTLRRNGSFSPRGGSPRHPPGRPGAAWDVQVVSLGGRRDSARRVGRPCLRRPRGPQRADRGGVSVTRSHADTEGSRPGTRCWVVAAGASARRERGRASAERPLTRRAKQASRSEKTSSARGAINNLHGVEDRFEAPHRQVKEKEKGVGQRPRKT